MAEKNQVGFFLTHTVYSLQRRSSSWWTDCCWTEPTNWSQDASWCRVLVITAAACALFLRATALYATAIPSVRLVTRVHGIKPGEHIIEILSPSDRSIILVFRHQGLLRKSDGFTPNGGAEYKGVVIFDQWGYISETIIDRGIFRLLQKTNTKSHVLYRMVLFSMTLSDPEPQFQGHSIV